MMSAASSSAGGSGSGGATETTSIASGLLVDSRSFNWKIENFEIVRKSDKLLYAQKFVFRAGGNIGVPTKWECYLSHPDSKPGATEERNGIGAYYRLLDEPPDLEEVNASFVFKIKKTNGEKFFTGTVPIKNMADEEAKRGGWGFEVILERHEADLPLVDGCLIIETEFKIFAPKPKFKVDLDLPAQLADFDLKSISLLRSDLGKMRENAFSLSKDTSTKVISKDGVSFSVNRAMLSARSPVFERMFQSKMKESRTGVIQLNDLSSKSVNSLLHYIYTGQLHQDWKSTDVLEELIYAAHKYELHLLTQFFDQASASVCTLENCGKVALLAKRLGMKKAEGELFKMLKTRATSLEDLTFFNGNGNYDGDEDDDDGNDDDVEVDSDGDQDQGDGGGDEVDVDDGISD